MKTIIRAKGGTLERKVTVGYIVIPDIWHIAVAQKPEDKEMLLELWHLCHDLLKAVKEKGN